MNEPYVHAIQASMALLTQVLDDDALEVDLSPVFDLTTHELHLAVGVVAGLVAGLALSLEEADPGWSASDWLAGVAAQTTAMAMDA